MLQETHYIVTADREKTHTARSRRTARRIFTLALALLVVSCGEPLQLTDRTPGPSRTPLIEQSTRQTTATNTRTASITPSPVPTATPPPASTAQTTPATRTPPPVPTVSVVIIPATPAPRTNEELWREQQVGRAVLDPRVTYVARQPVPLLWWDPATGQVLEIGLISGEFPAQARFTFRGSGEAALEVPYTINQDFGLTAISGAVRSRMAAAGYTATVEAFIIDAEAVEPRP